MELARELRRRKWRVGVACTCGTKAGCLRRAGLEVFPVDFRRESLNPSKILHCIGQVRSAVSSFRPDLLVAVALRPILLLPLVQTGASLPAVNFLNGLGTLASGTRLPIWLLPASCCLRTMLGFAISRPQTWTVTQNQADFQEATRLAGRSFSRILKIPGTGIFFPFRPPAAKPRKGSTRFLFVGRLLRDKGILELLQAFQEFRKKHPKTVLEIIGTADPANPSSLTPADLKPWKGIPKVSWLGRRQDIPKRMQAADCVVIPSYREGLPKVLLEAAASARPVISTDIPGCRELVVHGKTGLTFAPRDISGLEAALERIHLEPGSSRKMALALYRKAKEKCSIKQLGQTYDTLFRRVLRNGSG